MVVNRGVNSLPEIHDREASGRVRAAPQRARIDVARPSAVIHGWMVVPVENQIGLRTGEERIQVLPAGVGNDRGKPAFDHVKRIMEKRDPVPEERFDDLVGP